VTFPEIGDRFLLAVRGPAVAGRDRFARFYAAPDNGAAYWTTSVTCGTVDVRTGRERIEAQGGGSAWLDGGHLAGTWSPAGVSGYGEAQMRVWSVDRRDGLEVEVVDVGPMPQPRTGRPFAWRLTGASWSVPSGAGPRSTSRYSLPLGYASSA